MPTVMEGLTQALTPDLTAELGATLGIDTSEVQAGVRAAGALLIAALNQKAATEGGADAILGMFKPDQDAPANVLSAIDDGRSDEIIYPLFGIGVTKAVHWIRDTTNQDLGSFLLVAAPLVMYVLHDAVQTQKLDAAGLTALLKTENDANTKANRQFASEINAALDAGQNVIERAARIRARFTEEEWATLAKTPTLAGYAVMMSALSGPVGINKEISALIEAMEEFGEAAEPDSLVGIVSRQFTSPEQITKLGANRENATPMMRDACLEAVRILTEKESHEEAQAYKQFVVNVAARVAEAAIDGGIMSMGGKPISDEEQTVLDLIAAALAYQPE